MAIKASLDMSHLLRAEVVSAAGWNAETHTGVARHDDTPAGLPLAAQPHVLGDLHEEPAGEEGTLLQPPHQLDMPVVNGQVYGRQTCAGTMHSQHVSLRLGSCRSARPLAHLLAIP